MNTQKTIFNKLFSSKTNLKRNHKVSLSKIDELSEMSSQAYGNMEYALEKFYEGRELIILARDILRFEEPRPSFVHDELMAISDSLEELGLDIPDELKEVSSLLTDAEEKHNEVYDQMENLGINPMVDRL